MKNISFLILILSFTSWNYENKTAELKTDNKNFNAELIGIYEFKSAEPSENHYIVIDTLGGKYIGLYFGTEGSGGHGVFFYQNKMEKLNMKNGKISFEVGTRELYETTRFRIIKTQSDLEKDSEIGISKYRLKYNGEISNDGIRLKCQSEYGDCWENEMKFDKLTEGK